MTVNEILYYIVAFDALVVLVMGVIAAGLILSGRDIYVFWDRVVPATAILVATSLGAGVILWIGDYLFVGAS